MIPESDSRSSTLRGDISVESTSKSATKPVLAAKKTLNKTTASYADDLVDFFLQQLAKCDNSAEARENLRGALIAECTVTLNAVQNTSFAAGFKAKH